MSSCCFYCVRSAESARCLAVDLHEVDPLALAVAALGPVLAEAVGVLALVLGVTALARRLAVDVHVLRVLRALAHLRPLGAVLVVVRALLVALLARHRAVRQHPARVLRALAHLRPRRAVPVRSNMWSLYSFCIRLSTRTLLQLLKKLKKIYINATIFASE